MLKKIPFKCLAADMRHCQYVEESDQGFALPLTDDELDTESQRRRFEIVEVIEAESVILVRPLNSYDENEWAEISGAREFETDPSREITQDPRLNLKDKYEILVAVVKEPRDMALFEGMRMRIVNYKLQPGIVEAVCDPNGNYVITEIMVFTEKPWPAYWVRIQKVANKDNALPCSKEPDARVKAGADLFDFEE